MNSFDAISTMPLDTQGPHQNTVDLLPLGIILHNDGEERDRLLYQCALDLISLGYRLGGVVQSSVHRKGRRKCDMYLMDLFTGEEILISVDRGNDARGCRLDPAAFARITVWGQRALGEGVDLLVVNKFGKEEASGRGLRPIIAEALISEKPVIIGVSGANLNALIDFVGDTITYLPPNVTAVISWCRKSLKSHSAS